MFHACLVTVNFAIMMGFIIIWGFARAVQSHVPTLADRQMVFDVIIVGVLFALVSGFVASRSVFYISVMMIIIAGVVFDVMIKDQLGLANPHRSLKLGLSMAAYLVVLAALTATYNAGWWGNPELGVAKLACGSFM
mgnify:CR=1 FL=1